MSALLSDATFFVAIGLAVFIGILVWKKVPGMIGKMLDEKSAAIAKELDDARKLREDAAALLSSYQRKQRDAEREADDILAGARAEAERIQAEARTQTAQVIERRTKLAEQKIAQAELSALAEVKAAAADAAIAAARTIIEKRMGEDEARAYANASLNELRSKLN
ncbi:MAG TPA: ATP F0F1 synthase subunit B [Micropepsaceae bacterium]|nr:ATP F0F1 synthase subunit B [Micropepsaceae bacterium]HRK70632.1 ATP F0F1 synthase subunit B [Micropepsaceae bacterium]